MASRIQGKGLLESLESKRVELDREVEAVRAAKRAECQALLAPTFAAFFEANPRVRAVSWRQYTPSWRDGEECHFGVDGLLLHIAPAANGPHGDDEGFDGDGGDEGLESERAHLTKAASSGRGDCFGWGTPEQQAAERERKARENRDRLADIDARVEAFGGWDAYRAVLGDFEELRRFVRGIDRKVMEMAYGDPVEVTYTGDGVTVAEYEDF